MGGLDRYIVRQTFIAGTQSANYGRDVLLVFLPVVSDFGSHPCIHGGRESESDDNIDTSRFETSTDSRSFSGEQCFAIEWPYSNGSSLGHG